MGFGGTVDLGKGVGIETKAAGLSDELAGFLAPFLGPFIG